MIPTLNVVEGYASVAAPLPRGASFYIRRLVDNAETQTYVADPNPPYWDFTTTFPARVRRAQEFYVNSSVSGTFVARQPFGSFPTQITGTGQLMQFPNGYGGTNDFWYDVYSADVDDQMVFALQRDGVETLPESATTWWGSFDPNAVPPAEQLTLDVFWKSVAGLYITTPDGQQIFGEQGVLTSEARNSVWSAGPISQYNLKYYRLSLSVIPYPGTSWSIAYPDSYGVTQSYGIAPGYHDWREWYPMPSSLQFQVSPSRYGHDLRLRQPHSTSEYFLNQSGSLGAYYEGGQIAYWYSVADGWAIPGLDFWVFDATTNENSVANSTNLGDWIHVTPPTIESFGEPFGGPYGTIQLRSGIDNQAALKVVVEKRFADLSDDWSPVGEFEPQSSSYNAVDIQAAGLPMGYDYLFQARAIYPGNQIALSNQVAASTTAPYGIIYNAITANLLGSSASVAVVAWSCANVIGEGTFYVEARTSPSGRWVKVGARTWGDWSSLDGDSPNYIVAPVSVTPGETYQFRVRMERNLDDYFENPSPIVTLTALDGGTFIDLDNDGVDDAVEVALGLNPNLPDTDEDGMRDGWELYNGLDPKDVNDGSFDPDGDNYVNRSEFEMGSDPLDRLNGQYALGAPRPPIMLRPKIGNNNTIEINWRDLSNNEQGFRLNARLLTGDVVTLQQAASDATSATIILSEFTEIDDQTSFSVEAFNSNGETASLFDAIPEERSRGSLVPPTLLVQRLLDGDGRSTDKVAVSANHPSTVDSVKGFAIYFRGVGASYWTRRELLRGASLELDCNRYSDWEFAAVANGATPSPTDCSDLVLEQLKSTEPDSIGIESWDYDWGNAESPTVSMQVGNISYSGQLFSQDPTERSCYDVNAFGRLPRGVMLDYSISYDQRSTGAILIQYGMSGFGRSAIHEDNAEMDFFPPGGWYYGDNFEDSGKVFLPVVNIAPAANVAFDKYARFGAAVALTPGGECPTATLSVTASPANIEQIGWEWRIGGNMNVTPTKLSPAGGGEGVTISEASWSENQDKWVNIGPRDVERNAEMVNASAVSVSVNKPLPTLKGAIVSIQCVDPTGRIVRVPKEGMEQSEVAAGYSLDQEDATWLAARVNEIYGRAANVKIALKAVSQTINVNYNHDPNGEWLINDAADVAAKEQIEEEIQNLRASGKIDSDTKFIILVVRGLKNSVMNIGGIAEIGGNRILITSNVALEIFASRKGYASLDHGKRTVAHEMGHMLGLRHPKDHFSGKPPERPFQYSESLMGYAQNAWSMNQYEWETVREKALLLINPLPQ